MEDLSFFVVESRVWLGLLTAALASYTLFLISSCGASGNGTLFARIQCFVQILAISMSPVALTLMNRKGLSSEDEGVRLLEEISLHIIRYNVFIRPLVGFVGVYIDIACLWAVLQYQGYSIAVSNSYEAALRRAASPRHSSWISVLDFDGGPLTAWNTASQSIKMLVENFAAGRLRPGDTASFGNIGFTCTSVLKTRRGKAYFRDCVEAARCLSVAFSIATIFLFTCVISFDIIQKKSENTWLSTAQGIARDCAFLAEIITKTIFMSFTTCSSLVIIAAVGTLVCSKIDRIADGKVWLGILSVVAVFLAALPMVAFLGYLLGTFIIPIVYPGKEGERIIASAFHRKAMLDGI